MEEDANEKEEEEVEEVQEVEEVEAKPPAPDFFFLILYLHLLLPHCVLHLLTLAWMASAIWLHWSMEGSTPVGLCAQPCSRDASHSLTHQLTQSFTRVHVLQS